MTNEIYKAMIGAELTHAEHSVASAIISASAPQSVEQVAAATRADIYNVRRVLRALVGRKILTGAQSGGLRVYSINEKAGHWQ